jgi:ADP-ribose pyrophosphatase YjhB (NUDIX family)
MGGKTSTSKHPRRPRLGVCGIIIPHNGVRSSVLLTQRSEDPGKGMWHFPGGAVEFGESMHDALARELQEELKLAPEDFRILTPSLQPATVTSTVVPGWDLHSVALYFFVQLEKHARPRSGDGTAAWAFASEAMLRRHVAKLEFLPAHLPAVRYALGWEIA